MFDDHRSLITTLSDRIVRHISSMMPDNNPSVYVGQPVPVTVWPHERDKIKIDKKVIDGLVGSRIQIGHYVVSKVDLADKSRSAILVTLAPSFA